MSGSWKGLCFSRASGWVRNKVSELSGAWGRGAVWLSLYSWSPSGCQETKPGSWQVSYWHHPQCSEASFVTYTKLLGRSPFIKTKVAVPSTTRSLQHLPCRLTVQLWQKPRRGTVTPAHSFFPRTDRGRWYTVDRATLGAVNTAVRHPHTDRLQDVSLVSSFACGRRCRQRLTGLLKGFPE